jgi:hypothetical protein
VRRVPVDRCVVRVAAEGPGRRPPTRPTALPRTRARGMAERGPGPPPAPPPSGQKRRMWTLSSSPIMAIHTINEVPP